MSSTNTKLIYKEDVVVDQELRRFLIVAFKNHLILYNHALSELIDNPNLEFKEIKNIIYNYIQEHEITEIIHNAVYRELHYLYKKFKHHNLKEKMLTDIHYMTFTSTGSKDDFITINGKTLTLGNINGVITLPREIMLPDLYNTIYFNISYSTKLDTFMLSVFIN